MGEQPQATQSQRQRLRRLGWFLVLPATVYVLAFNLLPLAFSAGASLFRWNLAQARLAPAFQGLENYATLVFEDAVFQQAARNTAAFMIITVGLQTILGLMVATLLNQNLRGTRILTTLAVIPMSMAPAVVAWLFSVLLHETLGPVAYLFRLVGLQSPPWLSDSSWALPTIAFVEAWQWTPFMVLMLLAGLKSQSPDLHEAAKIDGATAWQRFRFVTLPLLAPVLTVAIVLRTIDAFKMFDLVYLLTNGGPGTSSNLMSLYGYKLGVGFFDLGRGSAVSMMLMIGGLLFAIVFYRVAGKNA